MSSPTRTTWDGSDGSELVVTGGKVTVTGGTVDLRYPIDVVRGANDIPVLVRQRRRLGFEDRVLVYGVEQSTLGLRIRKSVCGVTTALSERSDPLYRALMSAAREAGADVPDCKLDGLQGQWVMFTVPIVAHAEQRHVHAILNPLDYGASTDSPGDQPLDRRGNPIYTPPPSERD